MAINSAAANARDRAEDLLHTLQSRAREWVDAEEGLVHTIRDLVDDKGLSSAEVKRRLEDLLGRIKANEFWERLTSNDKVVALTDYRDEVEKKVEEAVTRVLERFPLASKAEVTGLAKQVKSLNRKVNDLGRKLKSKGDAA